MTASRFSVLPVVTMWLALGGIASRAEAQCTQPAARIVRIANEIQYRRAPAATFVPAVLNLEVCEGDAIRTGDRSRATVALIGNAVVLTIDQNTEWIVRRPPEQGRSIIDLIRGAILFFTHQPQALEIQTPFVNAAVKGTEFVVRVGQNRTDVTVLVGEVELSNPDGTLTVGSNQSAFAVKGQAPQFQVVVRPRDAVQWALYYQPALPVESFQKLEAIPEAQRDASFYMRRASALLSAGRLDEARADIDRAISLNPTDGAGYSLRAVIAVALNDRDSAITNGREALARSPKSAVARTAMSYAHQASFELDAARSHLEQAVVDQPGDPLAWARLAELSLSLGDQSRALQAAERAASLAPGLARAQIVVGFARLGESRLTDAESAFLEAIRLDAGEPLARLGSGLTKIRRGDLVEGRADLELAVALDPENALLRSYLGKAYFEEKRDALAAREFDRAKILDPMDPTPWLYQSIQDQAVNRPVQALRALDRSIQLNDHRAVYRSRLLLDQDLAARGAKLSRIYRDLGFEQLALAEGWKSLDLDPANHSAHRLLADNYLSLPSHQIASDSELLQAQLLQPVNINPVQPRLADNGLNFLDQIGISDVGVGEYTGLFASNGLRLFADGIAGTQSTGAANVMVSGIANRLSFSVGHFDFNTDGIRENNDLSDTISNVFVQGDISSATSVQVEYRRADTEEGDRMLLFDPGFFRPNTRLIGDVNSLRLGVRQRLMPAAMLIGSYGTRRLESDLVAGEFRVANEDRAHLVELRYLQRWRRANVTAGFGHYNGDGVERQSFGEDTFPEQRLDTQHSNGYVYATFNATPDLAVSGGFSLDSLTDSALGSRRQANPKVGTSWMVTPTTTLRAAIFRVLRRTLTSGQTVEPTHVAGFNQFFDDGLAAESWRYGIAADRSLWPGGYAGVEYTMRDITSLAVSPFVEEVIEGDIEERFTRAYLYTTLADRYAISAEYQHTRFVDPEGNNPRLLQEATTHRLPFQFRFFDPSGLIAGARATYVRQGGIFRDLDFNLFPGQEDFWTVDFSVGYRLPRRRGVASIDMRNAFDSQFRFQDADPNDATIVPGRQVLARFSFTF